VVGTDLVGAVLDARFRIESLVGEGRAGGFVYRALDTTSGSPVAIRTIPGTERFDAIAPALARLSDATADAERLLGWGTTGGVPWLAFEWLEGQSFEAHVAESGGATRSIGEAITILEPAARALARAHALGITHGDVRPANLWLARSDDRTRVKLTQFVIGESTFAPTHGAPEHFKPSYGSIGPWTDVYGLALTFVELVSGKRALEGGGDVALYLATSRLERRPTLRACGVATSDAVEAVLSTALAVDPKRRHQDAKAFWDALVAALPELTPATPATASARPTAAQPALVVDAAPRSDRSGTFAWVAVAFVAAAGVAIVGAKVLSCS
jgi:eukaryotic-like serine/threonine-protein kinase